MNDIQAALALFGIIAPSIEGKKPEDMIQIFEACHTSVMKVMRSTD